MAKAAIVVLADMETHGDMARMSNALQTVKEFKEARDEIKLIFDGAGVRWAAALNEPGHALHGLYESVKDKVTGVCAFCAGAFGVKDAVEASGLPFAREYHGHPSLRQLVAEDYQVITF